MDEMILDPRVFIRAPYRRCPKCQREESFGVLGVHPRHYVRRCRECWHSERFSLPQVSKAVVYLDQLAVSNLAEVGARGEATEPASGQGFSWREVSRRIGRLLRLQRAVFPSSSFHRRESVVSAKANELRGAYEALSGGIRFQPHHWIEEFQLGSAARLWNAGEPVSEAGLSREKVLQGKLDGWLDGWALGVDLGLPEGYVEELRRERDLIAEDLGEVMERWRREEEEFWAVVDYEAASFGEVVWKAFLVYLESWQEVRSGRRSVGINDLPGPSVDLFKAVERSVRPEGDADVSPTSLARSREFLLGEGVRNVPFVRIRAMLWAALARKVASGQKRVTRGVVNDFEMISTLLPYCDALFLDRECHALLEEEPLKTELQSFETTLFSVRNGQAFLDYLETLESAASAERFDLVEGLFGQLR